MATALVDPPRFALSYHYALLAEMWLAAGLTDERGAHLFAHRAERFLATLDELTGTGPVAGSAFRDDR